MAKRAAAAVAVFAVGLIGLQVAEAGSALAHANAVSGSAECEQDGTYSITWTIANDYQQTETATVTGHTPGSSTVSPGAVHIGQYGSGTVMQSGIPGSSTSATLAINAVWDGDNFSGGASGTVTLGGSCAVTPPQKTPDAPTVKNGSCDGSTVIQPTITIPAQDGVAYTLDGAAKSAGTYTVSAGTHTVVASSSVYTLTGQTSFTLEAEQPASCNTTVVPKAPTVLQSSCTASGQATPPTLTLPSTTGITYTTDKSAPYADGQTVTVTATAVAGSVFANPAPTGWTYVDSTHETYSVTFAEVTCTVTVTPQNPSTSQATCGTTGQQTAPTLVLAATTGIAYSVDTAAPYSAGQTVTITAEAESGDAFARPAPAGWVYVDSTHETYTVTFDAAPSCAEATPPTFSDDSCSGTTASGATYTIPSQVGVVYLVNGVQTPAGTYPAADGSTIVVTAQASAGTQLVGTTTFTHNYPASPNCTVTVVPAAATFTDDVCRAGSAVGATYTIPTSVGVDYLVDGVRTPAGTYPAADGSTVRITAVARDGYVLTGVNQFVHEYAAAPDCAIVATAPAFDPSSCVDKVAVDGTYSIPSTVGVQYLVTITAGSPPVTGAPVVKAAGTYPAPPASIVSIVAKPLPGYSLTGTTQFSHTYPATGTCTARLVPASVTFRNDACASSVGTATTGAAVIIPVTTGVAYEINGQPAAAGAHAARDGSTVTVTATAETGYTLTGITQWSHTFPVAPSCSGTDSAGTHKPSHGSTPPSSGTDAASANTGGLASTGVATLTLLIVAGAAVALGALLLVVGSRRRSF